MEKLFLYSRQKILLGLLEAFGGQVQKTDMQKYLFLFTQLCQKTNERSYDFVPYKFGCYSFQSEKDRKTLISMGVLGGKDWSLCETGRSFLSLLDKEMQRKMLYFSKMYKEKHSDSLLHEVYVKYPYYAINSEVKDRILTKEELKKVQEAEPKADGECFFTIGYEGTSVENYLNRLIQNDIKLVCDVRANPYSRKYGFSQSDLSKMLKNVGINYVHIPELGIVSDKRQELKTQDDYDLLFSWYEKNILPTKKAELVKLKTLLKENKRIAITCFEADVKQCHRGRIARFLSEESNWDNKISHI